MQSIQELLQHKFADNTLSNWSIAAAAFLVTFTVLPLLKGYLVRLSKRHGEPSKVGFVNVLLRLIPRTSRLFLFVVALNVAQSFLQLPDSVHRVLQFLIQIGVWFQVGLWGITVIDYFLERKQADGDSALKSSLGIVNFVARFAVWSLVALVALDNLGVNITALVAGLGVGGIAIALAVQTMLGDLLASLSITLDKPFAIGDNLALDDIAGKVEHIGIRSTRIRSVNGEQVIISNADLIKSRVRNFGRMDERRGLLTIGITYETPRDKVQRVVGIIAAAIKAQQGVRLDRCHFKEFGPSSLNVEAVFFVLNPALDALMNAQQDINFRILEAFEKEGIEFAYPTQKVFVANADR